MPDLFFDRHMPHLPDRLFDLVTDLEAYPRFIPNCKAMEVRNEPSDPRVRYAKMTLNFGPLTQAYTSRVTADPTTHTVNAKAVDGPFSFLDSNWTITQEGEGSRVRFDIDFKFNNPLIAAVAEPAFAAKQEEIMDAFAREADRRYGR